MEFSIGFIIVVFFIAWLGEKVSGLLSGSKQKPPAHTYYSNTSDDIREYGINEIRSSGNFTTAERNAEYRRRGKSPSGVIDGVYNDMYRGNDSYNDSYRDWDADA